MSTAGCFSRIRFATRLLAVTLLSVGRSEPLVAQALARDDYLGLLELSFRASQEFAVTYQVRSVTRGRIACYDLTLYRSTDDTNGVGAPPSSPCEGAGSSAPPDATTFHTYRWADDLPNSRWMFLPTLVRTVSSRSTVRELDRRNIAGLAARCFDVGEDSTRASICVESASGVVLALDVREDGKSVTLKALRMTGKALPPGGGDPDVKILVDLLARGMESTYTVDFDLHGSKWTYARSGGDRDYQKTDWKGWPLAAQGAPIEIFDAGDRFLCSGEGAAAACKRSVVSRLGPLERRDAADGHVAGPLIAGLLGDPGAEVIETEPRTIADRPARCFETRFSPPDNGDLRSTWRRAYSASIAVCVDRELGAVVYSVGGGGLGASSPLLARKLVPSADPSLFTPPYPVKP